MEKYKFFRLPVPTLAIALCLFSNSVKAEVQLSAEQAAKELANPNTALASLNFKLQYRTFKGDLAGADDQNASMVLFQPSLPFPLEDGGKLFFVPQCHC